MKESLKSFLIGLVVFCVIFYAGKFILYKLNVTDKFAFDIATVVGFAIGWFISEFFLSKKLRK